MTQSGVTTDGKRVVDGVFSFYETHGVPLDVMFEALYRRGCMVDWPAFMREATTAGMKPRRVMAMLEMPVLDTFGRECWAAMKDKLPAYAPEPG